MATSLKQQLEASHVAYQALLVVNAQLREDVARAVARADVTLATLDEALSALDAERSRRAYEGAAYRAKLASAKPAKRLAPSMDMSIDDDDLTPGQRAIRAHRAAQVA